MLAESTTDDLANRGYTREQLDEMHKAMKRGNRKVPEVKSLNVEFKVDLKDLEFPNFGYYYSLYNKYDNHGVLPFPGAHNEQPAKIMDIFDVLSAIDLEEQKRKSTK